MPSSACVTGSFCVWLRRTRTASRPAAELQCEYHKDSCWTASANCLASDACPCNSVETRDSDESPPISCHPHVGADWPYVRSGCASRVLINTALTQATT